MITKFRVNLSGLRPESEIDLEHPNLSSIIIKRLCPTNRCAFLFGEVLRCVHFGHKNDKKEVTSHHCD